jgi:tRNA threonylcarbamoyladenosine biosynthesis protein TsaE
MTDALSRSCERPEETSALGAALGALLTSGDFVALSGALGAGKTQFVKGIARGLEVGPDDPVVSPTFVLIREYVGRLKLYHIDAYRLTGSGELWALGLDEIIAERDAVVALEWADRVEESVPDNACRVDIAHAGEQQRTVRLSWDPARLRRLAAGLESTRGRP